MVKRAYGDQLTTMEIAEYFEVKENTVNQWRRRGFITPCGSTTRGGKPVNIYRLEDIQAFAQRKYGHS